MYNKSIDSGLSIRRHSLLVFYLKKLMIAYAENKMDNNYKFDSINV